MPPSWHPVPAFVNHDMPQAGHSSLQRRRIESDADLVAATTSAGGTSPHCSGDGAASIPKFGPEIKNRCTQEAVNGEILASILKFGLEIKNRCTQEGLNGEILAAILKSGPEIKNRCRKQPIFSTHLPHIPQHIPSTPPAHPPAHPPARVEDASCLGCFA